jgi:hypothetical protein
MGCKKVRHKAGPPYSHLEYRETKGLFKAFNGKQALQERLKIDLTPNQKAIRSGRQPRQRLTYNNERGSVGCVDGLLSRS